MQKKKKLNSVIQYIREYQRNMINFVNETRITIIIDLPTWLTLYVCPI